MTSYERALSRLPRRIRRELAFPEQRFLPLHGDAGDDAELRPARQVAERAVVLSGLLRVLAGEERDVVRAWIAREGLEPAITPRERSVFDDRELSRREAVAFSWQVERLNVLCWALGVSSELGSPAEQCDLGAVLEALPSVGGFTGHFIRHATLRPAGDVLDQLGIVFHIHAKVTSAAVKAGGKTFTAGRIKIVRVEPLSKLEAPGGVDEGVVLERHRALNWIVGYLREEWDDVSADT